MGVNFDVRTFVVDNKIFASTKRIQSSFDFRTNTHRGAKAIPYKLNDEEIEIILRASRASKAYLCGVDHIIYNDKIYILEVNGSLVQVQITKVIYIKIYKVLLLVVQYQVNN